jgi:hypothetical protein
MFIIERRRNKKMRKSKTKTLFVVLTLMTFMLSFLPFVIGDECVGQNCPADINLTIGNIVPTIPQVYSISAITLNGGTTKLVTIIFNASDDNGYGDLDISTAQVSLSKGGEITRTSSYCVAIENYTLISTISCDITMQFYDSEGSWIINASISDLASEEAINDTTTATINALDYVTQDVTYVKWISATLDTNDNEADNTITLTNGGNQLYPNFDITGQNATGQVFSDLINANQFSVDNETGKTSGQIYMESNTPVDVSSKLSLNSKGNSVTEQIFFYVDIQSGIRADNYLSDSAWAIQVS